MKLLVLTKKNFFLNKLLLFILIESFSFSNLSIISPPFLQISMKNNLIQNSLANFGDVPYGKSIISEVTIPTPKDGCLPIQTIPNKSAKIFLLERGNCHFSEKVLNAQNSGAKLVLIKDNLIEDVHNIFPVERGLNILKKVNLNHFLFTKFFQQY